MTAVSSLRRPLLQIALALDRRRTQTRRRNEPAPLWWQSGSARDRRRGLPRRSSFRGGPFGDSAIARADPRHDRRAKPRMRGHAPHVRQLPAHAERSHFASSADCAGSIFSFPFQFSASQRAPRVFSARARAAGRFLTIGVPRPRRGNGGLSRVPRAADPMRAERQQFVHKFRVMPGPVRK